jgi:hypothetical protein
MDAQGQEPHGLLQSLLFGEIEKMPRKSERGREKSPLTTVSEGPERDLVPGTLSSGEQPGNTEEASNFEPSTQINKNNDISTIMRQPKKADAAQPGQPPEPTQSDLEARYAVLPLTEKQVQQFEDMAWAREDPDVQREHRGEFVVPYRRQIVASGKDPSRVLADAARIIGCPPADVVMVNMIDPMDQLR